VPQPRIPSFLFPPRTVSARKRSGFQNRKSPRFLRIVVCLAIVSSVTGFAQVNSSATNDIAAVESHDGGLDVINLQNLDIYLNLPIRSRGGVLLSDKATSLCGAFDSGDSNFYTQCVTGFDNARPSGRPVVMSNTLLDTGIRYTVNAYALNPIYHCANVNNTDSRANQYTAFYFTDSSGGTHPFPSSTTLYAAVLGDAACKNESHTYTFPDGSGITATVQTNGGAPTWSAYDSSGARVSAGVLTDPNGNTFTTQYTPSTKTYIDPLGTSHPLLTVTGADGTTPGTYSWTDVNGTIQTIVETYTNKTIKTSFGCGAVDSSYSGNVVTKLSYPDGSFIGLSYEANGSNITGRLDTLTLRTGAAIRYQYSGGNSGLDCIYFVPPTMTRTTPDGTWTYIWQKLYSGSNVIGNTTTVLDPGKNKKVYTFTGLTNSGPAALPTAQVLTQVLTYQNTGTVASPAYTLLSTDLFCYNNNFSNCQNATVSYPITKKDAYHYVGSNLYPSGVETQYDSYGNVTYYSHNDFGATTATRATTIAYGSYNAGNCDQISTYIHNRPCKSITMDNVNATYISQKAFYYDGKGNLTQEQVWTGGGNWIGHSQPNTYNPNGTLATSYDPNGTKTTITYGDCNGFFPTQTQVKDSAGTILSTTSASAVDTNNHSYCGGLVPYSVTDANGNQTTYAYNDPFWRRTSETDPNGLVTTFTPGITSSSVQNSFISDITTLDSTGRTIDEQVADGSNYDTVSYGYTFSGTNWSTRSNVPCLKSLGQFCTSTDYTYSDPLGRPIQTTNTSGSYINYSYTQNNSSATAVDVEVTLGPPSPSENNKSVQTEYDGLGRTKSVCKMSSGAGSCGQVNSGSGYVTTYSYSDANGSTTVTATRGVQSRTKTFDAAGRLVYDNNPESGAVSYVYDTDSQCTVAGSNPTSTGDLISSTDANGYKTCRSYDALHRLTDVVVLNSNLACVAPTKRFRYDNINNAILLEPSGYSGSNLVGQIVEAWTGDCTWPTPSNGSKTTTDEWFSYDVMGNNTDIVNGTYHMVGYYHGTAGYAQNGAVTSIGGVPGYTNVTYGLDGQGRPNSANQGSTPLVNSVSYGAAGQPTNIYFGSSTTGDSDAYTYDPNTGRITTWAFTVGATPKSLAGTLNWNANGTLNNLPITNGFNSGGTQTCSFSYDDLARLTTDNCGSTIWNQTFSYDQYDNITKTGNPGTSWIPGYDPATNRYTLAGTSYDADGNLLNDSYHTYGYYPDGKLASIDSTNCTIFGSSNGTCIIYDAFGRIAEKGVNGSYSEFLYTPVGKTATMNNQTTVNARFPLPGGATLYETGSNGGSQYFWHKDWLGSVRLSSNVVNRTAYFNRAFAPYGEMYANFGATTTQNFTGDDQDILPGGLFDTPTRELADLQGRWMSPDPGRAGWNLYAYPTNPNSHLDPSGRSPTVGWLGGTGVPTSMIDGFWNIFRTTFGTMFTDPSVVMMPGNTPSSGSQDTDPILQLMNNINSVMEAVFQPELATLNWGLLNWELRFQQFVDSGMADTTVTVGWFRNTIVNPYGHIALGVGDAPLVGLNPASDAQFAAYLSLYTLGCAGGLACDPLAMTIVPGVILPEDTNSGTLLDSVQLNITAQQGIAIQTAMGLSQDNPPPYSVAGPLPACDCGSWTQQMLGFGGIDTGPPTWKPQTLMHQIWDYVLGPL
jgi:YD repeat-containing protein